jgi:hypothetical protein
MPRMTSGIQGRLHHAAALDYRVEPAMANRIKGFRRNTRAVK